MFKFVENLRLHEAIKTTDLYQISSGQITNPKLQQIRAEDKRRNDKITSLSEKLETEQISPAEFLEQMCESHVETSAGI